MSASSSRIMITPTDSGRPLSDRFIDRLLGWWDTGGGRDLRRALRDGLAAGRTKLRTVFAPALERPLVAKAVVHLTNAQRWLAKAFSKAFSSEVPLPPLRREEIRATVAIDINDVPVAPPPALITRSATAEIRPRTGTVEIRPRTGTVEIGSRSGTAEFRSRTGSSLTKPVITPVPAREPTTTAMTTNLRCWSCLQRQRVRAPRRGGCFLCTGCNATMLVLDPVNGLTCDVAHASARGISLNRQADETDPG